MLNLWGDFSSGRSRKANRGRAVSNPTPHPAACTATYITWIRDDEHAACTHGLLEGVYHSDEGYLVAGRLVYGWRYPLLKLFLGFYCFYSTLEWLLVVHFYLLRGSRWYISMAYTQLNPPDHQTNANNTPRSLNQWKLCSVTTHNPFPG